MKDKKTWAIACTISVTALIIPLTMEMIQHFGAKNIVKFIGGDLFYNVSAWVMVVVTIAMAVMNHNNIKETKRQSEEQKKSLFWNVRFSLYHECGQIFSKIEKIELEDKENVHDYFYENIYTDEFCETLEKITYLFGKDVSECFWYCVSAKLSHIQSLQNENKCRKYYLELVKKEELSEELEKAKTDFFVAADEVEENKKKYSNGQTKFYNKIFEQLNVS